MISDLFSVIAIRYYKFAFLNKPKNGSRLKLDILAGT